MKIFTLLTLSVGTTAVLAADLEQAGSATEVISPGSAPVNTSEQVPSTDQPSATATTPTTDQEAKKSGDNQEAEEGTRTTNLSSVKHTIKPNPSKPRSSVQVIKKSPGEIILQNTHDDPKTSETATLNTFADEVTATVHKEAVKGKNNILLVHDAQVSVRGDFTLPQQKEILQQFAKGVESPSLRNSFKEAVENLSSSDSEAKKSSTSGPVAKAIEESKEYLPEDEKSSTGNDQSSQIESGINVPTQGSESPTENDQSPKNPET